MVERSSSFTGSEFSLLDIGQDDLKTGGSDDTPLAGGGAQGIESAPPADASKMRQRMDKFFGGIRRDFSGIMAKFSPTSRSKEISVDPTRVGGDQSKQLAQLEQLERQMSGSESEVSLKTPSAADTRGKDAYGMRYEKKNGLPALQVGRNLVTIDRMTVGKHKIPDEIKQRIAESPKLMEHLRKYEAEGFKLRMIPEGSKNHAEVSHFVNLAEFSLKGAEADPDAFLKRFATTLLHREARELDLDIPDAEVERRVQIDDANKTVELRQALIELGFTEETDLPRGAGLTSDQVEGVRGMLQNDRDENNT